MIVHSRSNLKRFSCVAFRFFLIRTLFAFQVVLYVDGVAVDMAPDSPFNVVVGYEGRAFLNV